MDIFLGISCIVIVNKYIFYSCEHTTSFRSVDLTNFQQFGVVHIGILSLTIIYNISVQLLSFSYKKLNLDEDIKFRMLYFVQNVIWTSLLIR